MYILGISPDGEYFKVALIRLKRGKLSIVFLQEFQKDILDLDLLKKKIARESGCKVVEVISALVCDDVLVRHIDLPLKSSSKIFKALPFQMESLLPFGEEAALTIPLIRKEKKGSKVVLYSVMKETLDKHILEMNEMGFDPDIVTCIPMALRRFAAWFVPETTSPLIFHFGWENSHLVYVREGIVKKALTIKMGFKDIIDAIKMHYDRDEIDFQFIKGEIIKNAEADPRNRTLGSCIENFKKQIHRVMEFLIRKEEMPVTQEMLFTGYADVIRLIYPMVMDAPRPILEITPNLLFSRDNLALFAIEIGLGLDGLERDNNSLQFRLSEFTPKKEIGAFKKKSKLVTGLFTLCSALLFFALGLTYVEKQQELKKRFYQVVHLIHGNALDYPSMNQMFIRLDKADEELKKLTKKVQIKESEGIAFREEAKPFALYLDKILQKGDGLIDIQEIAYYNNDRIEMKFTSKQEGGGEAFYEKMSQESPDMNKKTTFKREKDGFQLTLYVEEK